MIEKLNITIIEDVNDIRNSLKDFLDIQERIALVSAFNSMEAFFDQMQRIPIPDVVLSDIGLPGMNGIEGIQTIRKHYPQTDIIMLTVFSDHDKIFQSICAGATGYVLKGTPLLEVYKAILDIQAGGSYMSPSIARKVMNQFAPTAANNRAGLTTKEKEIIQAIVDGLSYKLIAAKLNISLDTVRTHIKNIYRKLQVNSKGEVIGKAFRGEL